MVTGGGDAGAQLRALAEHFLAPELVDEVARLYALEAEHQGLRVDLALARGQLNRAQRLAGELRGHVATLTNRIAELAPEEIIKARRDAYMLGVGFLRITSIGRHRYASEHLPAQRVSVRAD